MANVHENEVEIAVLKEQILTLQKQHEKIISILENHVEAENLWQTQTSKEIQDLLMDKRVRLILKNTALVILGVVSSGVAIWKVWQSFFPVINGE